MIKGFEKFKDSKKIDTFKVAYDTVEHKLEIGKEPKMEELRKWFIYRQEKEFNTKLLGTNVHYCYKTFNSLKDKYNLCNSELAKKMVVWSENYKRNYTGVFDFSSLNTNWLIEKLNNTSSFTINNDYKPNTSNRRI